jgi:hypothetical protein
MGKSVKQTIFEKYQSSPILFYTQITGRIDFRIPLIVHGVSG